MYVRDCTSDHCQERTCYSYSFDPRGGGYYLWTT